MAWGDDVLNALPRAARARFAGGRFVNVDDAGAWFALPNETHRARCDELRGDVETVLAAHFGRPVPLKLVVDDGSTAHPATVAEAPEPQSLPQPPPPRQQPPPPHAHDDEEEIVDVHELEDAPTAHGSAAERVAVHFPGAELVIEEEEVT
jgi:hypothetical protein